MINGSRTKRRPRDGDEQDVFTGWRKAYCWTKRAGACAAVKRRANRRERQEGKLETKLDT